MHTWNSHINTPNVKRQKGRLCSIIYERLYGIKPKAYSHKINQNSLTKGFSADHFIPFKDEVSRGATVVYKSYSSSISH